MNSDHLDNDKEILVTRDLKIQHSDHRVKCYSNMMCGNCKEAVKLIDQYTQSKLKAFAGEVDEALPNKKTDITGYHEDHTPEQLTRITAMNRFYNQAIDDVKKSLKAIKGKYKL